ncbi:hypothetical protein [Mycobacterium lacus]|uniref:Uncharacterized protein n=1 Tax=Mycobacterium lacus TaxID=169765 RepID=A0A1X1XV36_9MYCO|nr:hypothetical protein [Mycobacterium lacus]MCV7122296.1 hypothetical protein [Mycobacterium lacus]ORW02649.1 hypothetical protein AWC15_06595 [Mycobacterium lacus]BBX97030.1 hypothetical protein MLAC_23240 [Mycobacterium lacus]
MTAAAVADRIVVKPWTWTAPDGQTVVNVFVQVAAAPMVRGSAGDREAAVLAAVERFEKALRLITRPPGAPPAPNREAT